MALSERSKAAILPESPAHNWKTKCHICTEGREGGHSGPAQRSIHRMMHTDVLREWFAGMEEILGNQGMLVSQRKQDLLLRPVSQLR